VFHGVAAKSREAQKAYRYLSRFECKYYVDPLLVPEIRQTIQSFATPDRFAKGRPGYRYEISSLYLDSADLRMYQQTVGGVKNRFKLRMRTYDDDPASPVFLEIKERMNALVGKWRLPLTRSQAASFLDRGSAWHREAGRALLAEVDPFASRLELTSAKPVAKVKYVREAYEYKHGGSVRITLDTDLASAVAIAPCFLHGGNGWVSTPLPGVILEIKFTERFPDWIQRIVETMNLQQVSIPKYVLCMDELLARGAASSMSLAGFCLPPRWA
jgi:hypothetical protein